MANISSLWARAYLQAICSDPRFGSAMGVAPLWLAQETNAEGVSQHSVVALPAARVTIQMAAEMFPRLAVIGPAGAGKTTLLRQLTRGLAEAILAEEAQARRGSAITPLPLYIELSQFEHTIEATLAASFNLGMPPSLGDVMRERPLLLLLDGLEELAPEVQLVGLSALAHTIAQLGTQVRWIATCRPENLPLFRPWLGVAEVRNIRPLSPRDVMAFLQRQHADTLAAWLKHADDLVALASRMCWLAALPQLDLSPPYSRGRLMAKWLAAVLAATTEAHPTMGCPATLEALPALADALDQRRQDTLTIAEVGALDTAMPATAQCLIGAGILTYNAERRQVKFAHPVLRSFAQA
ncbi:MAG TPA: NACHT domain-containing protein, partial [Roseiflexaceae bacterium]|nr:NACHT domain-containing protein [Roseiflexaceae bacterium]